MRLLLGALLVAGGVAIALFLADHPGAVSLTWQGWQIETSIGVLVLAVVVLVVAGWLVLGLIRLVFSAPSRYVERRRSGRAMLGYRAVTDGLVALAAGDLGEAERHRRKAEAHFSSSRHRAPPLTRLLTAQTALLRNDAASARREFTAMLDTPETEFLGLRGLIVQELKLGDDKAALALVERANRLRPRTAWVLETQFALQARLGAWADAQRTLSAAAKAKVMTPERERRHRVAVLLARSSAGEASRRDALKLALAAHGIDPSFAPAAIRAATLLAAMERPGRAAKLLEATWRQAPHPDLVAQYDALDEHLPVAERLNRLDRLIELRADEPAGHLVAAALALNGRLWGEARRHLAAAGASDPAGPWSARLCTLMAETEEGEGQHQAALVWHARIALAKPDPQWLCETCETSLAAWSPRCPHCGSFDTLEWKAPELVREGRVKLSHPSTPIDVSPILQLEATEHRLASLPVAPNPG